MQLSEHFHEGKTLMGKYTIEQPEDFVLRPGFAKRIRRDSSARWRSRNLEKAREHTRLWRAKQDPQKLKERQNKTKKQWMSVPQNRIAHCLGQARRRAKQTGIDFAVTVRDLLPLPQTCSVLAIKINYNGTGARGFVDNSPSVDRIDARRGYVPGNVRVISWRANRLKSDATVDELKAILAYVMSHDST